MDIDSLIKHKQKYIESASFSTKSEFTDYILHILSKYTFEDIKNYPYKLGMVVNESLKQKDLVKILKKNNLLECLKSLYKYVDYFNYVNSSPTKLRTALLEREFLVGKLLSECDRFYPEKLDAIIEFNENQIDQSTQPDVPNQQINPDSQSKDDTPDNDGDDKKKPESGFSKLWATLKKWWYNFKNRWKAGWSAFFKPTDHEVSQQDQQHQQPQQPQPTQSPQQPQ